MLTGTAENLDEYYSSDRDVSVFDCDESLLGKIKFYLKEDAQRTQIANAGYERTLAEHTYEKRFEEIFAVIGLH